MLGTIDSGDDRIEKVEKEDAVLIEAKESRKRNKALERVFLQIIIFFILFGTFLDALMEMNLKILIYTQPNNLTNKSYI